MVSSNTHPLIDGINDLSRIAHSMEGVLALFRTCVRELCRPSSSIPREYISESVISEYVELTARPALINLIINTGMGRGWYFRGFRQSLTSLAPSLAHRLRRTTNCLNFRPVCQSTRLSDEEFLNWLSLFYPSMKFLLVHRHVMCTKLHEVVPVLCIVYFILSLDTHIGLHHSMALLSVFLIGIAAEG